MRPVPGEFGFATSDEQESCFLEDKADSLYRLGEIGGRKECNTLHSWKGLSPLSFFGIHRFRPAGVRKAGSRRMALVVQWGNWSAEKAQIIPMFILVQRSIRRGLTLKAASSLFTIAREGAGRLLTN